MVQFTLYDFIYAFTNVFWTYTIYKFMGVFFNSRRASRKVEIITYSAFYIFSASMFLFVNIPIILIFFNLLALIALSYNYESTLKNRIVSALLMYLILAAIEIIVGVLSGYLDFSLFSTNTYSSIFGLITCRLITYVVVLILNNFKNIKKGETVPNSYWFSIVLIPSSSLYVILLLFMARSISTIQVMVGMILIILINFATFYLFDVIIAALSDKIQNLLVLEQNKYYDKQLEMIKTSLQTTSTIRHDLKNHMFSIRSLIESGDKKETLEYISEIMDDIGARKDRSSTGNTVIDSIINFKLQEAEQRNIKTNLDLKIPEKLEIPSFDMTVILGNLLDNAIKALDKVKDNPFINLKIKYDKGRLMIQTDNPYEGDIIENEGKLLTTQEDKANHGIGLQSVKKVIQKYDGIMDIDHSGNIFSISLMLYVD